MEVRKFFKKHPKIRQLLCKHYVASDIGTLKLWSGQELLVHQCEICGLILVDYKRYRLPHEFDNYEKIKKCKSAMSDILNNKMEIDYSQAIKVLEILNIG